MKRERNKAYKVLLQEIVQVVQQSQLYAVRSVQQTTNLLYWEIGKMIIERQNLYGWGAAVADKLSLDLQEKIGAGQSWSACNLRMLRQLYEDYTHLTNNETTNVKQLVPHLAKPDSKPIVTDIDKLKQLVSKMPWRQNILILQKVKELKARVFYLKATIQNRWSRATLILQIKAREAHHRLSGPIL